VRGAAPDRPDRATAPTSVKGLEALPVDIRKAAGEAAKEMSPRAVMLMVEVLNEQYAGQGSGGAAQESETTKLTLADVKEILEGVERDEGYEAARHFGSHLDFGELTALAMGFVSGEDSDTRNDPNIMPTRFMLLYGADDSKLQQMDDHPDLFDGEEHRNNVANLRKALRQLGYELADTGPYDDEVLRAHLSYLARANDSVSQQAFAELEEEVEEEDVETGDFTVHLDRTPRDADIEDDTFILYSTDRAQSYKQVKTVKDDTREGNDTLDFVFTGLDTSLRYTLEIDRGASGNTEYVFRNRAYGEWIDA